jgi:hypothetical protein
VNKREYTILAGVIGRTTQIMNMDKNAVRRQAKHAALSLLTTDLTATLAHEYPKTFNEAKFLRACGL